MSASDGTAETNPASEAFIERLRSWLLATGRTRRTASARASVLRQALAADPSLAGRFDADAFHAALEGLDGWRIKEAGPVPAAVEGMLEDEEAMERAYDVSFTSLSAPEGLVRAALRAGAYAVKTGSRTVLAAIPFTAFPASDPVFRSAVAEVSARALSGPRALVSVEWSSASRAGFDPASFADSVRQASGGAEVAHALATGALLGKGEPETLYLAISRRPVTDFRLVASNPRPDPDPKEGEPERLPISLRPGLADQSWRADPSSADRAVRGFLRSLGAV